MAARAAMDAARLVAVMVRVHGPVSALHTQLVLIIRVLNLVRLEMSDSLDLQAT